MVGGRGGNQKRKGNGKVNGVFIVIINSMGILVVTNTRGVLMFLTVSFASSLSFSTGEADLVVHHVKNLLEAGVGPSDMAVIAPYNLQVGGYIGMVWPQTWL